MSNDMMCQRFIDEFGADILARLPPAQFPFTKVELDVYTSTGWVMAFFTLLDAAGRELRLMDPETVYFDPQEPDEETVLRVVGTTGTGAPATRRRLEKAKLIDRKRV